MSRVILPVGLRLGAVAPPPTSDRGHSLMFRFAGEIVDLESQELSAWLVAAAAGERMAELSYTRANLEQELSSIEGFPAPADLVDSMISDGLLLEFDPNGAGVESLFRNHQLFPTAEGLGTKPDDPHIFRLGQGDRIVAEISIRTYLLWATSSAYRNLWDACVSYARLSAGKETAHDVASPMARNIPLLIASGCAFIDKVLQ